VGDNAGMRRACPGFSADESLVLLSPDVQCCCECAAFATLVRDWREKEDSQDGSLWARRLRAWVRAELAPRLPQPEN
jgi:hypothetical protein